MKRRKRKIATVELTNVNSQLLKVEMTYNVLNFKNFSAKGKVGFFLPPERMKPWERADIAKIEHSLLRGFRDYMYEAGFIEVQVPHITKATGACENIATMFSLDYFGRQAYLTQTAQLQLEVLSQELGRVFTLIRSFRAEPEVDDRHLTEFSLFEFEHVSNGDLNELLRHIEATIWSGVRRVADEREEELERLGVSKQELDIFRPPYERMEYEEAIGFLQGCDVRIEYGDDLKSEHEKLIASEVGPVFITHWPKHLKFFNMRESEIDESIVLSADLELPGVGESVGGAEREIRYERLKERLLESTMFKMLVERGGNLSDFDWYLDFWRTVENPKPHAGCGIGVARVMQSILQAPSIKDVVVYPMDRLTLY